MYNEREDVCAVGHLNSVWIMDEMMRGPPLAPSAARRRPSVDVMMAGDMELCGFLKGRMKLDWLGGRPYVLVWSGVEKSSIWLFRMMPAHAQRPSVQPHCMRTIAGCIAAR